MINRILIRIKVVQMLYSYLLTRTDFKIATASESPSADKKFAYSVYVDLMLVLLELCGYSTQIGRRKGLIDADKKLLKSKVAAALSADDTIKSFILKGNNDIKALLPVLQGVHDKIVASSAYGDYKKRRSPSLEEEVAMWTVVFETVVMRNQAFVEALRGVEGFTNAGMELGVKMFVDTLDSYRDTLCDYALACANLEKSLDLAYSLYVSFFGLIVELTQEEARRIEAAKTKFLATADERNPNLRFVENAFAERLAQSENVNKLLEKCPINWNTEISLVNSLLAAIKESPVYEKYMSATSTDYSTDCEFWRDTLRTVVFQSEDLLEVLEDKSVFWNDDLQIMGTFVLKTIRQSAGNPEAPVVLLDKYKDEEDAKFGGELFVSTVKHRAEYREYIDSMIDNNSWDPDRLVFMDIVIMLTAITELVDYPNIPLAVTMNEYVEIANDYSSPKSGQFVNGILFNVVNLLREKGILAK